MNQQIQKRSTIYYITLVAIHLHVSTLLRNPQSSCPVPAKLHKHLNAELVIFFESLRMFVVKI
jgi:hypothetical protein